MSNKMVGRPLAVRRGPGPVPVSSFRCLRARWPVARRLGSVHPSKLWRRATRIVGLAVGMHLTVAGAPAAFAGTYAMWNCNVPGHANSLMHPWQQTDNPAPVAMVDACATGGGVGFSFASSGELGGGRSVGINIQKPTGARSQIKFVKLVLWYAARLTSSGQPLYFRSDDVRTNGAWYPGLSNAPPGSENVVAEQQLSPDTQAVYIGVQCGPGGVVSPTPCVMAQDVPLLIRGIEVTLSEEVPPIVSRPSGTLLAAGVQSGVRTLTYSATDAQSGLSKIDVLLGDTVVASHDLTARCTYSDFTVCPDSQNETLQIDTRGVANGRHRLTVRVRDAAGNEGVVNGESTIDVANGPGPEAALGSGSGTTNSSAYTLRARFRGVARSTLTVPYGRRVTVHGRLTQGSQPVATGSPIELFERRELRGAREVSRGRIMTKADGSFSAVLSTTRPSRTVRLAYRPTNGSQVVSRVLKLRVRAASRVRASLRGLIVRFSGRVLSRPVPRVGKRIVMEGRSPGAAWTAFKTLRTDRTGRFSGTYRLRVRRPGVRLRIRAVVPREKGYGYLASRSAAVTFRVR